MPTLDQQFAFAFVYLLPLIPAIGLILALGRSRFVAKARGNLAGFSIQAGGGFGAYVVLVLMLAFVRAWVLPLPQAETFAELFINVEGDPAAIARFMEAESRNVQIVVHENDVAITRLSDFFVTKTSLITTTNAIPARLIAEKKQLGLELVGTNGAKLTASKAQAGTRMTAKLRVEGDPDNVRVLADIQEVTYDNDYDGVRVRHVMVFENDGDVAAQTIDIGPTQLVQPFQNFKIVVRKISGSDEVQLAKQAANEWSRVNLLNLKADDSVKMVGSTWAKLQELGNAIGRLERTDWGPQSQDTLIRSASLELIWGVTPRLRDIPGGLNRDEVLVYLMDYKLKDTGRALKEGDTDTIATLTKYQTERLILAVRSNNRKFSSDRDAVELKGPMRSPAVHDPRGEKARLVQLEKVPRLVTVGMAVRFD